MPDQSPAAGSPSPAPQGAGQPGPAQQAPFGSSPATGPTPNKGYEAAAAQRLGLVIKQLEALIPMAGAGSDIGRDVLKALNMLVKHVPPGSVSPAAEKNQIEQMAMRNAQGNQQMQALKAQMAQGGQGGMPGGGAPKPAMPGMAA